MACQAPPGRGPVGLSFEGLEAREQGRSEVRDMTTRRLRDSAPWILPIIAAAAVWGCSEDARLADASIKPAVVVDVVDSGLNLDRTASPDMVAFALLKAIRDDVEAGNDQAAREAAFDRQYRLAAPAAIQKHHARYLGAEHAERDESTYKAVRAWAPTLAYYVDNFNFTWDEAREAMTTRTIPSASPESLTKTDEKHVLLEVRDPHDEPNASAIVRVRLVEEDNRWRVWWVGFEHSRRQLAAAAARPPARWPATAPTTQPSG